MCLIVCHLPLPHITAINYVMCQDLVIRFECHAVDSGFCDGVFWLINNKNIEGTIIHIF